MPLLKPKLPRSVASDFPYSVSMQSCDLPSMSSSTLPVGGMYGSYTRPCGTTSVVSTLPSPTSSCHSPLIAACICHDLTGPAPQHDSPDGQSALVAHGVSAVEHVRGTVGVAGW